MSGILLATHGGETAEGAARVASLLAQRLGVKLHALAVLEPLPVVDYGFGVTYAPGAEEIEAAQSVLFTSVREQLDRCSAGTCVPDVRFGTTAAEIVSTAHALDADLIVVGLGPHNVIDRALGGETALRLAHVASTPVLAVPASAAAIPRNVVAAVDFSQTSVMAACAAARWLAPGDTLHVVHVRPEEQTIDRPVAPAADTERNTPRLDSLVATLVRASGVCVDTVELSGDPARTLIEYAKSVDADAIALGSHGYGVWKRMVLGSVASKMIRLSTRSVLVVPLRSSSARQLH